MNWHKATKKPRIVEWVWVLSRCGENPHKLTMTKGLAETWYNGKDGWCVTPFGGGTMLPDRDFFAWVYDEECDLPTHTSPDLTKTD